MKNYMYITIIFLTIAILSTQCQEGSDEESPFYDELRSQTAEELERLYNIKINSSGGDVLDGISRISLGFTTKQPLTIEKGRRLAVCCHEVFLRNINAHRGIRPYLLEYPFPSSGVDIEIDVIDSKNYPRRIDSLAYIDIYNKGIIEFKIINSNDKIQIVHKETLSDALKIIRAEMQHKIQNKGDV